MTLDTSITDLTRVGKTLATRLAYLGMSTAKDVLMHFPFRYEDYRSIVAIRDLRDGEQVTVQAQIEVIGSKRSPRKRKIITEAVISDATGSMRIVWFGQPFISKVLKAGDTVYVSGKVKEDAFGLSMVSPVYEKEHVQLPSPAFSERTSASAITPPSPSPARGGNQLVTTHTARIVPMYSLTAGITQKQIRYLVSQVIPLAKEIPEWLPDDIRDRADVMPLPEALRAIHFPENEDEMNHAERRLKFDELFLLQLRAEMIRQSLKRVQAPAISFHEAETKAFVASLPFQLTNDQKIAAWEILQDLQKEEPMNRLLEGDVGSGKTVVAGLCMYNAALAGYQSVILAPTEILAKQHFETLKKLLPESISLGILTRTEFQIHVISPVMRTGPSDSDRGDHSPNTISNLHIQNKKLFFEKVAGGDVDIIVGTHALLVDDVRFKKLGLVIVDEQHRFGVEQRKAMREKGGMTGMFPHFLSMTATPIPRSFALTVYGDLDVSIIKQMPLGRKQIKTRCVEPRHREKAYAFIREQVRSGRQIFVICPLIDQENIKALKHESIKTNNGTMEQWVSGAVNEKKSVMAEYEKLSKNIFPDVRVGYLHGKLKTKEKDGTMKAFAAGELDILVATSVVEVGVNIPNASVMMIEGAERFGLAQLHQFRGRVGRAEHQSYCFLFSDTDLQSAIERMQFFEKITDGFALAEYDLESRGPGDVYGTAQSGMGELRLASMRDGALIKLARDVARGIDFEKYPALKDAVLAWEKTTHLE